VIRVRVVEPRDVRWREWKRRCDAQIRPFIKPPRAPGSVDADLYKECKDLIFAAYFHKCAYCEGKIEVQAPGDVEHFRPKNAVRDRDNSIVYAAKRQRHQGYWWLAYSHTNLLPSCIMCNRYTKKAGGKGERFPVSGYRATRPGEERKEKPLLIHPGRTDPAGHFALDLRTGVLEGLTESGKVCIDVLGLNREGLVNDRVDAIWQASTNLTYGGPLARSPQFQQRVEEHLNGVRPYSFVWRSVKADIARANRRKRR
jgi:hypothetical protein